MTRPPPGNAYVRVTDVASIAVDLHDLHMGRWTVAKLKAYFEDMGAGKNMRKHKPDLYIRQLRYFLEFAYDAGLFPRIVGPLLGEFGKPVGTGGDNMP